MGPSAPSEPKISGLEPGSGVPAESSFRTDVLRLVSGTGAAQAVALLAAPVLTRIYAPEAFGVVALFTSIVAVLGSLASLSYEQAIVLPETDREAGRLLALCIGLSTLVATLSAAFLWATWGWLSTLGYLGGLGSSIRLVPLGVLLVAVFNGLSFWSTRRRRFQRLAAAQVSNQVATTALNLGFGLAGAASGLTMISAQLAGQALATGLLGGRVVTADRHVLAGGAQPEGMWAAAARYRRFPLFTTWSTLLNLASWQLPIMMLGAFFSSEVVGFYSVGFRILQIPMSLLGGAVRQVFLQRASTLRGSDGLGALLESTFARLLTLSLMPTLVLAITGREIFAVVLGARWGEAGVYAQILAPWAMVWFISSPLSSLYYVLEKQREEVLLQVAIFASRVAGIAGGGMLLSPRLAVLFFAVAGLATYSQLLWTLFRFAGLDPRRMWRHLAVTTKHAVAYLVPVLVARLAIPDGRVVVGLATVALAVFFYRHRMDPPDRKAPAASG